MFAKNLTKIQFLIYANMWLYSGKTSYCIYVNQLIRKNAIEKVKTLKIIFLPLNSVIELYYPYNILW